MEPSTSAAAIAIVPPEKRSRLLALRAAGRRLLASLNYTPSALKHPVDSVFLIGADTAISGLCWFACFIAIERGDGEVAAVSAVMASCFLMSSAYRLGRRHR